MPLVDYGSSDDENSNDEDESTKTADQNSKKSNKNEKNEMAVSTSEGNWKMEKNDSDFGSLPTPSSSLLTPMDISLSILDRKRSQPIRITIPKLSDIEKELESTEVKKPRLQPGKKASGLFAILPEPKNSGGTTLSFKPTQLTKPPSAATPAVKKPPRTVKIPEKYLLKNSGEDDDDNEKVDSFFFVPPPKTLPAPIPLSVILPDIDKPKPPPTPSLATVVAAPEAVPVSDDGLSSRYGVDDDDDAEPVEIDDEAMIQLCGTRDRRTANAGPEVIDVKGSSLVGDFKLQEIKDLTQPVNTYQKAPDVSTLSKKKHQITYLAQQAKAMEFELKNQWAQNRMSRKQTQAKYGF